MFLERGGLLAISGIRDSLVKIECHIYSGYVYLFRACASPVLRLSIENLVGGFGIRNRPGVSIAQDDWIVSQRSRMKGSMTVNNCVPYWTVPGAWRSWEGPCLPKGDC